MWNLCEEKKSLTRKTPQAEVFLFINGATKGGGGISKSKGELLVFSHRREERERAERMIARLISEKRDAGRLAHGALPTVGLSKQKLTQNK